MTLAFILATLVMQPILLYLTFYDTTPQGRKDFFKSMSLLQTSGLVTFIMVFSFIMAAAAIAVIVVAWELILVLLAVFLVGMGITFVVRKYV